MKKLISLAYLAGVLFLSANSCPASAYFKSGSDENCCTKSESERRSPLEKDRSFVCCDEARVGTLPSFPQIDPVSIASIALFTPPVILVQSVDWDLVSIFSDPDPPNAPAFLSPPTRAPPVLTS